MTISCSHVSRLAWVSTPAAGDRYFEVHAVRALVRELWKADEAMLWKAAPKPSMADGMYQPEWWQLSVEERYARMHEYDFAIADEEPIFDAADIMVRHRLPNRNLTAALSAACPLCRSPSL